MRCFLNRRGVFPALILGSFVGCSPKPPEPPSSLGSWKIATISPTADAMGTIKASRPIPSLSAEFEGNVGFARATLNVERSWPNQPTKTALYDVLFPVPGIIRLGATPEANPTSPIECRISICMGSTTESSAAFVEPEVPFLAPDAQVVLEILAKPGDGINEGNEVDPGRWTVRSGSETAKVTVRVLFSKKPTNPRLKPEGKPPL